MAAVTDGDMSTGNHVQRPVPPLQSSLNDDERLRTDEGTLPIVEVWLDYQVHQPELVLQHEEDEPLGGSRPLTAPIEPPEGTLSATKVHPA